MTAPQTERPARDGETCTCGAPAVTVYITERFGEVGYCGVPGAGHEQQQAPEHPDWCVHHDANPGHSHMSKPFANTVYVVIVQHPGDDPAIHLSTWTKAAPILSLTAAQARMVARVATKATQSALREAADELERIGGGA